MTTKSWKVFTAAAMFLILARAKLDAFTSAPLLRDENINRPLPGMEHTYENVPTLEVQTELFQDGVNFEMTRQTCERDAEVTTNNLRRTFMILGRTACTIAKSNEGNRFHAKIYFLQ